MDVNVTLAGFVGTTPKLFTSQNGTPFTSFRVASTKRYLDKTSNSWVDGKTIWFTVKAWRQPATNIAESLRKGDAVVVNGRLAVDEWTAADGPRTDLVVEATALGPDLTRGTARFTHRVSRREDPSDATPVASSDASVSASESTTRGDVVAEDAEPSSDAASFAMSA